MHFPPLGPKLYFHVNTSEKLYCIHHQHTTIFVRICLPCGRNQSSVDIAKCEPKFSSWKNFENPQKHQRRRSAWVGQADFGKLELNNRNHSGNCQPLVMNVIHLKHDQFKINAAGFSDLREQASPFQDFY